MSKQSKQNSPPKKRSDPASYTPEVLPPQAATPAEPQAEPAQVANKQPAEQVDNVSAVASDDAQAQAAEKPSVALSDIIKRHIESLAQATPVTANVNVNKSSVASPVKLVHIIASKMYAENPAVVRKDVIAECEKAGIATHTARTQYQIWSSARKADEERTRQAASAPPKNGVVSTGSSSKPGSAPTAGAALTPSKKVKFPRG